MRENKSGNLAIIIIIIVAALGLGYLIGFRKAPVYNENRNIHLEKPDDNVNELKNTPAETGIQNKIINKPQDWKVFNNPLLFGFYYPPKAKMDNYDGNYQVYEWGPTQTEGTEMFDGYSVNFRLENLETGETLRSVTEAEYQREKNGPATNSISEIKDITINGYDGLTFTVDSWGISQYILLKDNNNRYIIITKMVADPGKLGFEDLTKKTIESFKFCSENCPLYAPPPPGWCDGGKIVPVEVDICECPKPARCEK